MANMKEVLDDAAEKARSLMWMSMDQIFVMLFYKDFRAPYVSMEERTELVKAIFSYTDEDDWSRFPDEEKVKALINSIREKIGLPKRTWDGYE